MTHSEYADRLRTAVDTEGKRTTERTMERLSQLMTMAAGNVALFQKLVEADRNNFMKATVAASRNSLTRVDGLGREFGKAKR